MCSWVKLWMADSFWPLQTKENISPKYLLRSILCNYTEKWLLPQTWVIPLETLHLGQLMRAEWKSPPTPNKAGWRENSVVEKEAHRLGGGSGSRLGLALRPLSNHTISEPPSRKMSSKDRNTYATGLSLDQSSKNMQNTQQSAQHTVTSLNRLDPSLWDRPRAHTFSSEDTS